MNIVGWNHDNQTAGFSIDGKSIIRTPTRSSGYLAAQVAANPHAYALMRADKDVQYSNISDAMSSCANAGISKVSFAVITSGNQQHQGAVQAATPVAQPLRPHGRRRH